MKCMFERVFCGSEKGLNIRRVGELNAAEARAACVLRRRENIRQFLPPIAIRAARTTVRCLMSRPLRRQTETVADV